MPDVLAYQVFVCERVCMTVSSDKSVLTTGEVARLCHVAPRTVSKWFDQGKLRGYRIPGSRDRRIPRAELVGFMRAFGMPMDALDAGVRRVLLVSPADLSDIREVLNQTGRYELRQAANSFDAGVQAQQFRPHVVVLDVAIGQPEACAICGNLRRGKNFAGVKVLAASADPRHTAEQFVRGGFDGLLRMPPAPNALAEAVTRVTGLAA